MTHPTLNGQAANKMPLCGVYAVAYAAGKSLDEVFPAMKKKLKKKANWKGRTYFIDVEKGFKLFGVKHKEYSQCEKRSLRAFVDDTKHLKQKFFVGTPRHWQIVEGEFVTDQTGTFSIDNFWGKNKRVKLVHILKGVAQ